MADALRDHCRRRINGMKALRKDYEAEWQDIARFAQPARSRFLSGTANKPGERRQRNNRLLDSHGIEAFRTLANGMTSGLSSPSRPWFKLGLEDEDLSEQSGVREYLSDCEKAIYRFLARTNFYGAAKSGYAELGLFGTEACVMVEHPDAGMVCHSLTAGEYWLALGSDLSPDSLARETWMTAREAVLRFKDKAPKIAKQVKDEGADNTFVKIYNLIEPNADQVEGRLGSHPWRSVYFSEDKADGILEQRGFYEKPFWAPRWDVVGSGTVYGTSPGMEALPALRELQMQSKRRNEAIDGLVKPEKVVPAGLRLTGEPGRTVSGSGITKDSVVIPYQVPYQAVAVIGEERDKCYAQIDALSYADLFNAITNMQGIQPRNMEEIASRNEEKLTQLGPVIESIGRDKLEVVIDRAFGILQRGNMLPPVPEALGGMRIDVEFISVLAQMQRMVGVGQIERTASFVGGLIAAFPDAGDKLNIDEMIDDYADRAGAPAKIIRGAADVEQIRAGRAAQQNAQQAAAMMAPVKDGADAARLLSETDVGGAPLLDTLMGA